MKVSIVGKARISTKRVALKKMLEKEMVSILAKLVKGQLWEDIQQKNCIRIECLNLGNATVSPELLKFGVFDEKENTWVAKEHKGIILFELFAGASDEAQDDDGSMYFLLKVPRRGDFFVRLGDRLEIVRRVLVSVAKKAAKSVLLNRF